MRSIRPGWGKIARSGAFPPLTCTKIWVSKEFVPLCWMLIPVQVSKSAQDLISWFSSWSEMVEEIFTVSPSNCPYCSNGEQSTSPSPPWAPPPPPPRSSPAHAVRARAIAAPPAIMALPRRSIVLFIGNSFTSCRFLRCPAPRSTPGLTLGRSPAHPPRPCGIRLVHSSFDRVPAAMLRHASTHHPSPPTPQCKRLRLSCARDSDQFSRNDPVTLAPRGLSHTACPMQVASCGLPHAPTRANSSPRGGRGSAQPSLSTGADSGVGDSLLPALSRYPGARLNAGSNE